MINMHDCNQDSPGGTSEHPLDELYIFSDKRFFINNVDSYHGKFIFKELQKFLDRDEDFLSSTHTLSQSVVNEEMTKNVAGELPAQSYEIIATVTDPTKASIDKVARIITKDDLGQVLSCGNVVIDITCDPDEVKFGKDYLDLVSGLLNKEAEGEPSGWVEKRNFILVSTALTWALSKPLDPDVPDMAFVETDFRKRRPHPNYKVHRDLENDVMQLSRKNKGIFNGIVLNIGVTYGGEEDILEYWFQKAWENEPVLPIFGLGYNIIPLINVRDVATIIYNLFMDFPVKLYILGVEQNISKQREIIKAIGRKVGTGMFKCIPKEDAFLIPEITQRIYDSMTMNVSMEPGFIVETMDIQWASENVFPENIPKLISQYKKEKDLKPFKIVLHGPPGIGKTTVAKRICETYGLMYLSPETVQQDIIADLTRRIEHMQAGEIHPVLVEEAGEGGIPEADDEDQDEGKLEEMKQTLLVMTTGVPPTDQEILGYIRQRMVDHEAQNKGWVLDGFPQTLELCSILYNKGDDVEEDEIIEEDEKFAEDATLYDSVARPLLPDVVISLEGTDKYICDKIMSLPESEIRGTKFEEETLIERLADFRANNIRELTPLNFYDELDIHPLVVPVDDVNDYAMDKAYARITLRMGRPCRYGQLLAAILEAEKKEKKERDTLEKQEQKAKEELEKKMRQERQDKMEYWTEMYSLIKEEEEVALAVAAEPLRNYLVKHIFPTLTPALLEIAKVRPEDPLDYLAEYLFKLNPTGKMLEPGYNVQAELLLNKIKMLDESLLDLDIHMEPSECFAFGKERHHSKRLHLFSDVEKQHRKSSHKLKDHK